MSQECLSAFKNKPEQNPFFIDLFFPPLLLCITVSVTHMSWPAADQAVCGMKNKRVRLSKLVPSLLTNLSSKSLE